MRQAPARGAAASPPATAANPPPGTGENPSTAPATDTSSDAGDQPVNLFEAAAQANRAGGGGGGAARIPRGLGAQLPQLQGAGAGAGAAAGGAAADLGGNLDFLRTNPQFQQLRQIVQTQPQMLEPILQQVAAGNPQLAQIIGQNPDQFLQLLSEEADGDAPLPPGAQEVQVTPEERDAIERVSPPRDRIPICLDHFEGTSSLNSWNPARYSRCNC